MISEVSTTLWVLSENNTLKSLEHHSKNMTTMQRWEGRGGMTILCFLTCFVTQTSLLYKVITWEFWKNYIMFRRHLKTFIGSWRKQKLRLTQNWLLWCALIFVIGSPQRHLETIFASVQTLTKTPEICFHFHFFQQPICLFIFLIKKKIYTYIYRYIYIC